MTIYVVPALAGTFAGVLLVPNRYLPAYGFVLVAALLVLAVYDLLTERDQLRGHLELERARP